VIVMPALVAGIHVLAAWMAGSSPAMTPNERRARPPLQAMTHMPITRDDIVAEARSWIGTPYRHQASLKGVGCDCLGLVRGVWRALHGAEPEAVPPYARDWAEAASRETLAEAAGRHLVPVAREAMQKGDVVLFRWRAGLVAKHAAILTSEVTMVHAHDGAAVAEVALAPWWRRRLAYVFRFPGVS
jgi:NlpC/P60 family putative phage cell wall peptidase